jgi:hypothetical protein
MAMELGDDNTCEMRAQPLYEKIQQKYARGSTTLATVDGITSSIIRQPITASQNIAFLGAYTFVIPLRLIGPPGPCQLHLCTNKEVVFTYHIKALAPSGFTGFLPNPIPSDMLTPLSANYFAIDSADPAAKYALEYRTINVSEQMFEVLTNGVINMRDYNATNSGRHLHKIKPPSASALTSKK